MKTSIKRITIAGAICLLIGIIGLGISSLFSNDWQTFIGYASNQQFKYEQHQIIENPNQVLTIQTDLKDTFIELKSSDTNQLEIIYSYNDKHHPIRVNQQENTIEITRGENQKFQFFSFFSNMNKEAGKVVISLPSSYDGTVALNTTNQTISGKDVKVKNLQVHTTNGKINLENINSIQGITLKTSNDKIYLKNIQTTGDITIKTTNGKLELEDIHATTLTGKTTNDAVSIKNVQSSRTIELITSNGKINGDTIEATDKITFSTTNDSILLKDLNATTVEATSTNGKINGTDVYGKTVKLHTTNDKIILNNTPGTPFVIDLLDTFTTNDSEQINAKYERKVNY